MLGVCCLLHDGVISKAKFLQFINNLSNLSICVVNTGIVGPSQFTCVHLELSIHYHKRKLEDHFYSSISKNGLMSSYESIDIIGYVVYMIYDESNSDYSPPVPLAIGGKSLGTSGFFGRSIISAAGYRS